MAFDLARDYATMGPNNHQKKARNSFSLTAPGAAGRTKKQAPVGQAMAPNNTLNLSPAAPHQGLFSLAPSPAPAVAPPAAPAGSAAAAVPTSPLAAPPPTPLRQIYGPDNGQGQSFGVGVNYGSADAQELRGGKPGATPGHSYDLFTPGGIPGMDAASLRPGQGGGYNFAPSAYGQAGGGPYSFNEQAAKSEALQGQIADILLNGSNTITQRFSGSEFGQDLQQRAATPQGFTPEEKAASLREIADASAAAQTQGVGNLQNALAARGFGDSPQAATAEANLRAQIGANARSAQDQIAIADAELGRNQQNIGTDFLMRLLGMQQGQEANTANVLSNFQFPINDQGGAGGQAPAGPVPPATGGPASGGYNFAATNQGQKQQYYGAVPQGQVAQLPGGMVNPNLTPIPQGGYNLGPLANTNAHAQQQLPLDQKGFLPGTMFTLGAVPSPQQLEMLRGNHAYRAATGQDISRMADGRAFYGFR